MKLIYKKIIAVTSGYFASLPFFLFNIHPIFDSIILALFFIAYYYLVDRIFEHFEEDERK